MVEVLLRLLKVVERVKLVWGIEVICLMVLCMQHFDRMG